MFLRGIASGNQAEAHIIVKRYRLPSLVHGRGPTYVANDYDRENVSGLVSQPFDMCDRYGQKCCTSFFIVGWLSE